MHRPHSYNWDHDMNRRWGRGRGDAWAEFWSEWWRGPAPRAERGVVRYLILDSLRAQPRHGYEIIQAIVDRSRGAYRPSPGVIYPTLQMLEEMRLARTVEQGDRKVYELTDAGRAELAEHDEEVADFYAGQDDAEDLPAEEVAHVMKRIGLLIKAFKRGSRRGRLGPTRIRKIVAILDETLDKLHALLDEDA
jgi:DNA-binding PadR family transcriptional regulator